MKTKMTSKANPILDDIVELRRTDRRVVGIDWLVHQIRQRHLLPNSLSEYHADYFDYCTTYAVRAAVREYIQRNRIDADADAPLLPGMERWEGCARLQRDYDTKTATGWKIKPLEQLSLDECRAIMERMRKSIHGQSEHLRQFERFYQLKCKIEGVAP